MVRNGAVRLDGFSQHWWPHKMQVTVKAPAVNHFELSGANALEIQGYRQDKLQLDISGAAEVTASGEADEVRLDISGTGLSNADTVSDLMGAIGKSVNYKIETYSDDGTDAGALLGTYSGAFVMTANNLNAPRDSAASGQINLANDGPYSYEAA